MAGLLDGLASFGLQSEEPGEEENFSLDPDDIEDEFSEAEKLLAKAAYYKAIARNGVVEEDGTPQSTEVNLEARQWARQQMAKMLGRAPAEIAPAAAPLFTEAETGALKRIASIALAKMSGENPEPVVKRVETKPAPRVKQVASQQPKPTARPAAPSPPPTPAPKKKQKQKVITPRKTVDGEIDYESIPSGQPFKRGGSTWKWVDNPNYDPDKPNSRPRGMIRIDLQATRATGALPMPDKAAMEAITASQAMAAVNQGKSANTIYPDEQEGPDVFVGGAVAGLRNQ